MSRRCVEIVKRWHQRHGFSGQFYGDAKCWKPALWIVNRDVAVCGDCKLKMVRDARKLPPTGSSLKFTKIDLGNNNELGGS